MQICLSALVMVYITGLEMGVMKSDLQFWHNKIVYDLIDAALLIVEKNPEKYSDLEELKKNPPVNFIPIYKDMLLDAVSVEDDAVQSEDNTDEIYTRYVLHTDQSDTITTKTVLSLADGRNYTVNKSELRCWLKKRNVPSRFFEEEALTSFDEEKPLSDRERDSLHRIIKALLETLLREEPNSFRSQNELVTYLVKRYKGYEGFGETNLGVVFAIANKSLE